MDQHSGHGHEGQYSTRMFFLLLLAFLLVQHWPVLVYHVALQVTGLCGSKVTLATFVWLFSSVLAHVGSEVSSICARIIAFCASEGLVP